MKLPAAVQDIADIIGRERALFLIGKLPRHYNQTNQKSRCCLYVPKMARLKPDHSLVKLMGWSDAVKLSENFGGEIFNLPTMGAIYRPFRDQAIVRLLGEGVPVAMIAEWFGVCDRLVKNLNKEKPHEAKTAANDNNRAKITKKERA